MLKLRNTAAHIDDKMDLHGVQKALNETKLTTFRLGHNGNGKQSIFD